MIAVDTNVLAGFYCDDPNDSEAKKQRPIARRIVLDSPAVFVPLTVILELEWVMRGFYEIEREIFCKAIDHLLGMAHVTVERWDAVQDALHLHRLGLEFADAVHLTCSAGCERLLTFDDRKFARRAAKLKLRPEVTLARTG